MRNVWKGLLVFGLLSSSMSSYGQQVDINSLHYSQAAKQTRMIFDVSASPKHRVFVQNNPSQLVIDIKNAKLGQVLTQPSASHPLFGKIHVLEKTKDNLRLAVDLKQPITAKNFSLSSNNKNEHKLIIDLINKGTQLENASKSIASKTNTQTVKKETLEHKAAPVLPTEEKTEQPSALLALFTSQQVSTKHEKIVIAIDPGHGGEDPGAHGTNGTEEKKVVFAIAKRLAKLINAQPDMKAVMVRKGDYYVGLRKRMQIARAAKADLFISIHADAFQDTTVKGSSVYVLS
ncbi:MAG: N-acetylmuramoyl-L-alanine amidase, partial [Methylococcaceae bacterium NSP1-2]